MTTSSDLQYLKRATPADLMKLTNDIPWPICAIIRAALIQGHQRFVQGIEDEMGDEVRRWRAAGVPPLDPGEITRYLDEKSDLTTNLCAECGHVRYLPPRGGRRISFSRRRGFGLHYLCGDCTQDWDNHFDVQALLKSAKGLQERWKGRCFVSVEVAR